MKTLSLYDNTLTFEISDTDWNYLCTYRFFSDNPPIRDIEAEFGSGTGISRNKPHLWKEASDRFSDYIQDLREIIGK